jgi:hypothetical protein
MNRPIAFKETIEIKQKYRSYVFFLCVNLRQILENQGHSKFIRKNFVHMNYFRLIFTSSWQHRSDIVIKWNASSWKYVGTQWNKDAVVIKIEFNLFLQYQLNQMLKVNDEHFYRSEGHHFWHDLFRFLVVYCINVMVETSKPTLKRISLNKTIRMIFN